MTPKNILEDEWILKFLKTRNLVKQYKKAKANILSWNNARTYFKERQPKGSNIWYFRINNQYRAWWSFDKEGDLLIFKIDDHS